MAGIPPTTEYAGKLLVTTELAPIIHPIPITTLGYIETFSPTNTLSSIITGPGENNFLLTGGMSIS